MDRIATEIKMEIAGIKKLVIYADDVAACGNINAQKLIKILEKYKFKVNPKKSCSFLKSQPGIPHRKTYKYLGSDMNDRGLVYGKVKLTKALKSKAKNLSAIGKHNPAQGLRLLLCIFGGSTNFHILRQNIIIHPGSLVKLALGIPMSLNNDLTAHSALAILQKNKERQAMYASEILRLLRFNGTKTKSYRRLILYWSEWYKSTE